MIMEDKNTSKPDEKFWKDLWNKYSERSFDRDIANSLLDEWKTYKEKIEKGALTLDEYTNLISDTNKQEKKSEISSYLTNFIERETKFFGYSKGGNAKHYMIKMHNPTNEKNKQNLKEGKYYVKGLSDDSKENSQASDTEAKTVFENELLPLLKDVVTCDSLEKLTETEAGEKYKNYTATQMLRKMVVLNSLVNDENNKIYFNFIFAYKNEVINRLYEDLVFEDKPEDNRSSNESYYKKNYAILNSILNILEIKKTNLDLQILNNITTMLWEYATYTNDNFPTEEEPNVIFYGAPGTGKTYAVNQFLKMKNITPDHYKVVQFHPSFTYEDFIEGIKPTGIDNGNVKLELVNGIFKQFCIEAKKDPNNEYYFIADEINRANLSSVFGETLSLLEADYRDDCSDENNRHLIDTQYSQLEIKLNDKEIFYDEKKPGKFGIPKNIRFIGMMNDVDKSIDSFDLALRRRFKWIRKDCDYDAIENELSKRNKISYSEVENYCSYCKKLNEHISKSSNNSLGLGKSYEFGHSFFIKIVDFISKSQKTITVDARCKLFDSHLRPTLQEYLRGVYESDEDVEREIKKSRTIFTNSDTESNDDEN